LRAAAPQGFRILTLRSDQQAIVAGWPLVIQQRRGRTEIGGSDGILTPHLGVLLAPPSRPTYTGRLTAEIEATAELLKGLPPFSRFEMAFHHRFTNGLPFQWAGFGQTTTYTYVIPSLADLAAVYANFDSSKRRQLKQAARAVTIHQEMSAAEFYHHHAAALAQEGQHPPYRFQRFDRLFAACRQNHAGKAFCAVDPAQRVHAAIFVVYDRTSGHCLLNSTDRDFRDSGATALLVKQALTFLHDKTAGFLFEGCNLRCLESSHRRFGGLQVPRLIIRRDTRSPLARLLDSAAGGSRRVLRRWGLRPRES
jgi:hypothetical protein